MFSNKEKIQILNICADIFAYPDNNYMQNIKYIKTIAGNKFEINEPHRNLDDIIHSYVFYFDLNPYKFNIVPVASFWIDGKIMGVSAKNIEKFYEMCGLKFNSFGPPDHLSHMLAFCAILLENNKNKEYKKFCEWFYWIDDLKLNIEKISSIKFYSQILSVCSYVLDVQKGG